jgi:membrane protein implicated in regulation of membrane protease activity
MPNIDYLKIFRDAWKITWTNRFLWWFGFFLLASGGANFNYFSSGNEKSSQDWQAFTEKIHLQEFLAKHFALIVIGIIALIILCLIFFVLNFISRGALIKSTQKILKNEPANFKTGLKDGKKYFGKIFSIFFFSGLAVAVCIVMLAIPITILFVAKSYIIAIILAIFALIILIPLLILAKYIQAYASFYVVLADLKPWLAVENAYALFKKNILASIIMSLLFIPLGILSFFILIAIALAVLLIFGLIGLVLFFAFKETGAIIALVLGLIVFIPAVFLFFSIFSTFSEVAWVLFFHVIATPKEKEKVEEKALETKAEVSALANPDAMKTVEVETGE